MEKENLFNTLDVNTQLRHALKAIEELTKENKELKSKINLTIPIVKALLVCDCEDCEYYQTCVVQHKTVQTCSLYIKAAN